MEQERVAGERKRVKECMGEALGIKYNRRDLLFYRARGISRQKEEGAEYRGESLGIRYNRQDLLFYRVRRISRWKGLYVLYVL